MKYIFLLFFVFSYSCFSVNKDTLVFSKFPSSPPFYDSTENLEWADSVLSQMTIEEKIGQSFFITANSHSLNESDLLFQKVDNLIKNYHVGGLIFFKSTPHKIVELVNRYQSVSKIPLINSIDGEWGVSMRIDSTPVFPWAMTLGAVQDNYLIYKMGKEIANQCKLMGLHMNFAPVVDVNNNPNNPIIGRRSFGENPDLVSQKAIAYMKGLQDNNILACAKHFPGHGDTDVDSHNKMPILLHNQIRLDSIELYPFNDMIYNGMSSIMVGHMSLPKIDSSNLPATLSSFMIQELLQKKLNFKGLIVTDALNMGGVKLGFEKGEVELKAYLAGNDILLYPEDVPEGIDMIKTAFLNGIITEDYINNKCRKILLAKKWLGLDDKKNIFPKKDFLTEKLNNKNAESINRNLAKSSLIVLKNNNLIPLRNLSSKTKIAYVHVGNEKGNHFFESLNRYLPVEKFSFSAESKDLISKLKNYDVVICGVHFKSNSPFNKHVLSKIEKGFLKKISKHENSILTLFSSPYILNSLSNIDDFNSIILSHQNNFYFQDLSGQLILGSFSSIGKMPISAGRYSFGDGFYTDSKNIISFGLPIDVGVCDTKLKRIDSIVNTAIKIQAIPGAQVLIAKQGNIIYNECFGFHTYDSIKPVLNQDIYDLASLTKIISAAPIFMNLAEENKISLDDTLGSFFEFPDSSDKKNISFLNIFTHQAQLHPWIGFHNLYRNEQNELRDTVFSKKRSSLFSLKVANNLFFRTDFQDSIINVILKRPLSKIKGYKYSDLGFYLLYDVFKNKLNLDVESYLEKEIYNPIESFRIQYNPIGKYVKKHIVPTTNDRLFRKQLLHGFVHDQGAALFGGISLHAGLFSNAIDLAKILQLYLNEGEYNDSHIFEKKTMQFFTKAPFKEKNNRRGVFFDKPSIDPQKLNVFEGVSNSSYGHTGFTGTMVWVDPKEELIYIFLSNRVHPKEDNFKLAKENIRTKVQQVIYESFKK